MLAGCQTQVPATTDTSTKTPVTQTSQEATTKASLEIKPTGETMEVTATSGREQFGSQVSPDGKWLLTERHDEFTEDKVSGIEHELIAKSMDGQGEKVLFTLKEKDQVSAMGGLEEVKGFRFTSDWTPAGWSKDGKKVYYAVTPKTEGLGGWYPNSNIYFEKIMEVDVATQTDKEVFNPKAGYVLTGVADFDATTQRAISLDQKDKDNVSTVTLTDLKTGKTQELLSTDKMIEQVDGVGYAMFSPNGDKVAIVTYTNPEEQATKDSPAQRDYEILIIDLATMNTKVVPQKDAGEFQLLNWVDNNMVKIHKYSTIGENDITVSVD
jgi:Tol biopolymer transport system component